MAAAVAEEDMAKGKGGAIYLSLSLRDTVTVRQEKKKKKKSEEEDDEERDGRREMAKKEGRCKWLMERRELEGNGYGGLL